MAVELGWWRLLVTDGNLDAGACKVVEKDLAVAIADALESIRTRAFGKVGRADAVLYGRRSLLIVIVVVAIATFGGAGLPSGLTMK